MKKLLLSLLFILFGHLLEAQKNSISFYTEEDFFPILIDKSKAKDQNYTMGFGVSFTLKNESDILLTSIRRRIGALLAPINKERSCPDWAIEGSNLDNDLNAYINYTKNTYSINGTAFTPDDLQNSDILYNDRPYSFLLYFATQQTFTNQRNTKAISYTLSLGIYGLRIGEFVQTAIHKTMNDNDTKNPHNPKGWKHQISDGFEPSLLYKVRKDFLINCCKDYRSPKFQHGFGYEVLLGYYTGIVLDYYGRLGKLDSQNWLNINFLSDGNKNEANDKELKSKKSEFFISYSLRPNFILYNQSLSGGLFATDYRLKPLIEANPFILEGSIGIGASIKLSRKLNGPLLNLNWNPFVVRTPDMWGSKIKRWHYWGGIRLGLNF